MTSVRKILDLLSPQERRQLTWLLPAIITMGLLEVVGIASVTPFLALVSDPAAVEENRWLLFFYDLLGFTSVNHLLIFLGAAALAVLTLSNAFTAFTTYHLTRFSYMRGYSLSRCLLVKYLYQPYTFFWAATPLISARACSRRCSRSSPGLSCPV